MSCIRAAHTLLWSLLLVLSVGCVDDGPTRPIKPIVIKVGEPCARDLDCSVGARCHASARGQGICTKPGPDCPEGSVALKDADALYGNWRGLCAPGCDVQCPAERCVTWEGSQVCGPPEVLPATAPLTFEQATKAAGISCDAQPLEPSEDGRPRWRLDFALDAAARSAFIVPFVTQGTLEILSVNHPLKQTVLAQEYRHHSLPKLTLDEPRDDPQDQWPISMAWPLMLPYAPQLASVIAPGQPHWVEIASAQAPCLIASSKQALGQRLELVIYLVGVPGLSPATAPLDPNIQEVLFRLRQLFERFGVMRVEVRFDALDEEATREHAVVRDSAQLQALTALGRQEGVDPRQLNAVHMFMVEDMMLEENPGLVGYSAGLPGAVGLAGNRGQGLVFSATELGNNNLVITTLIAHELGHYLGLRHTSEVSLGFEASVSRPFDEAIGLEDPILETPSCPQILDIVRGCPDAKNLMFPALPVRFDELMAVELVDAQTQVIRQHPAILP